MSEETPPPLRLKPRLRPADEGAQPESAPAPAPEPAATPADPGVNRLRLKPKLAAEPEPQPAAAPADPLPPSPGPVEATAAGEKPRLKPRLVIAEPEPAAKESPSEEIAPEPEASAPEEPVALPPELPSEEAPKFRLKPKTAGEASSPAPVSGSVPPPLERPAPAAVPKLPPPPAAAMKKRLSLIGGLAAVLLLGGAGYFGWQMYGDRSPAPMPAPARPAAKPAPTPSETLNQLASMPGAMINKAQEVISSRREREQDRIDAVVEGDDPSERRFLDTPPPGQLGRPPSVPPASQQTVTRAEAQIAPGVRGTTLEVVAAADASPAFRAFVGAMSINGVFQGSPPRALINGRTFRAGDTVDSAQGIIFDSADPATKTITFRDRAGATVSRKY